ncbi:MAG: DUF2262 domain-containing protein [Planctomycetota bacterium]
MPNQTQPSKQFEHQAWGLFKISNSEEYQKRISLDGIRFTLILEAPTLNPNEVQQLLSQSGDRAAVCLQNFAERVEKCKASIVKHLLQLANEYRSSTNQIELSREMFLSRIKLKNVSVHPSGGAFWFEDGNCFAGHGIVASFGPLGGLRDKPYLVG